MLGVGVTELSLEAHSEVSGVIREWSFGSVEVGSRRVREWTEVIEGRERRADRRREPTRPVEPTTAVEVILYMLLKLL